MVVYIAWEWPLHAAPAAAAAAAATPAKISIFRLTAHGDRVRAAEQKDGKEKEKERKRSAHSALALLGSMASNIIDSLALIFRSI